MKTESQSINDVLSRNATSFFIPPFQRAYAWGKTEIERFFDDVSRIIDSQLDEKQKDKLEHFFGTLVIKNEDEGFANKSVIIDGQQRLTTTLLYLIALRDTERDSEKKNFITQTYLVNNSSHFQDKIKLKQVTKDWEAYKALVNGQEAPAGIIKSAYDLLKKFILGKRHRYNFENFIAAIKRMNVAVIFLDERPHKGEDPQIIFETLNSLGKPLTLSDLVRNFILLRIESINQTKIYDEVWYPQIEQVLGEFTSKFFRDYLQYKNSRPLKVVSDNNTKELYYQFKDFVKTKFSDNQAFIKDIVPYVKCYKWIVTEINTDKISEDSTKDKVIKELLRNIFHDIKAEAFKPLVLGLLAYHQYGFNGLKPTDETLIGILEAIRTYLIRRRVIGLAQGENKDIVLLCKQVEEIAQKGAIQMFEILCNLYYRLRLPNDIEISKELASMNFYEGVKNYSKFILGKIEEKNAKVAVDFRSPKITIEHVMPQKLNEQWKKDLGDKYDEVYKTYLHNIGNLILTEFNGEIGNKIFVEKKEKLATSSLYYRLDIIAKNFWNEDSILEHQDNMIKWFLETFPLPDQFKEINNWNTKIDDVVLFSPLETNAGDIAEGSKPKELHIFDKVILVKTWQDVFIEFLKYLHDEPNFDFSYILDNQFELFRRDNVILRWGSLKELLDENPDFSNRYKTFGKETYEKVKDLQENTLFIHINFSASNCMSRVASVMEKLFLPEEAVKVKLK